MALKSTRLIAGILGAVLCSSLIVGCATPPEIDRTHRRAHTGMRGPAFKRLVLTYNEANNLAFRADRKAKAMRDSGSADPITQLSAIEFAQDIAQYADDIEWSLTNNQRIKWHRTEMNRFWARYSELYPNDESYGDGYTTKDMRKVTRKIDLKNQPEYANLHTYEHHDADWSNLFHVNGRDVYTDQIKKQDQ